MQDATSIGVAPPPEAKPAAQGQPEIKPLAFPNEDYFQAIIPEPPVVCGLPLKPLSVGRYRLMARFKVAFVADIPAMAGTRDLVYGVLICSMKCDEFAAFISGESCESKSRQFFRKYFPWLTRTFCGKEPTLKSRMRQWMRRYGFMPPRCFTWFLIGRLIERVFGGIVLQADAQYLEEQARIFQEYVTTGALDLSSRVMLEPTDAAASGAHWSQGIEATLREFQGWTKEEIDEEPLTKAVYDFYKHLEAQGACRFLTDEEVTQNQKPLDDSQLNEFQEKLKAMLEFSEQRRKEDNG
jgi:hypothetical protein